MRLATTTSVENSGLLGHLVPLFERASGIRVEVIPTGSGKALKLAENGDADCVLSHAPGLEREFLARQAVLEPTPIMYNEFVLVGPPEDPARVREATSLAQALRLIAAAQGFFFSRGDDSGTHEMERTLWQEAGIAPSGRWYFQTGQGMGATLRIAYERRGYTLSDTATFAQFAGRGDLQVLARDTPPRRNVYSVMATNPQRYPSARYAQARKLIAWLASTDGQRAIASFRPNGEELFHPLSLSAPPLGSCTPELGRGCVPAP